MNPPIYRRDKEWRPCPICHELMLATSRKTKCAACHAIALYRSRRTLALHPSHL